VGRRPHRHRVIRNILGDDRVRADDATLADANVGENHRIHSDKSAGTDINKCMFFRKAISDFRWSIWRVVRMVCVDNRAIGSDGDVILDRDIALADDMRTLFDAHAIPNSERRIPSKLWSMNYFKAGKVADMAVLSDKDSL